MLTRIYLDTVTIIAAIEGDSDEIAGRLAELMTREETACVSSELALAEALVGVWRPDKRQDWLALAYLRSGAEHGLSTCSLNAADLDALLARIAAS